ncbi:hypothetical protein [Halogeometricum limi]|uniref:Uncharacterized protein n=1 Tax=Halogeometricum limi TaxID=555875 RepID=A0A1I6FQ86_9EURY|nr:hypothetical protein [Halogeometricum limi]SFR32105.1 hypothetical protein SAMN04488124_0062 [Halogeometricum limi]
MGKRAILTLLTCLVSVPFVTAPTAETVGVGLFLAAIGVYATAESVGRRVATRVAF